MRKEHLLPLTLINLFNACLEHEYFPAEWKKAVIVLAHKGGGSRYDLTRFRPISLLPTIGKVFTGLLNGRITKAAERNDVFSEAQGGARSRRDIRYKLSTLK